RAALDSQAAEELSAHACLDDGPHRPFTPEDWLRLLARVTRDLHRLNISTLDAFFVRTASTFADEIGLPPGWGIADQAVADGVLAEALDDLLARSDTDELVELVRGLDGREVKRSVHEALKRRA